MAIILLYGSLHLRLKKGLDKSLCCISKMSFVAGPHLRPPFNIETGKDIRESSRRCEISFFDKQCVNERHPLAVAIITRYA